MSIQEISYKTDSQELQIVPIESNSIGTINANSRAFRIRKQPLESVL